jgi:TonB family protein
MRVGFFRIVSPVLLASAVLGSATVSAQNPAAAAGTAASSGATSPDSSGGAGAGTPASGDNSSQLRRIGGGVSAPVVLSAPNPQYSEEARKQKVGGVVLVTLIVDPQGRPQNVHVLRGVGMGLDEKAMEAVKQYSFKPAMQGGKPVAVQLNVEVNFQIKTKEEASAAASTGSAIGPAASAQTPDASSKYAIPGCTPDNARPTDADKALASHKFPDAERLYNEALAADPASTVAMAGLVRTTLAQGKLPDALAMATKYDSAHPNDAVLLDALAEVRFRRGETDNAGMALNGSVRINRCYALTHYDMARYLYLLGLYASSQRELERAHWLSPENPDITRRWRETHAVPQTAEQRLAALKKQLDSPSLTDPQKDAINAAIKGIESSEKGSCELVSPI